MSIESRPSSRRLAPRAPAARPRGDGRARRRGDRDARRWCCRTRARARARRRRGAGGAARAGSAASRTRPTPRRTGAASAVTAHRNESATDEAAGEVRVRREGDGTGCASRPSTGESRRAAVDRSRSSSARRRGALSLSAALRERGGCSERPCTGARPTCGRRGSTRASRVPQPHDRRAAFDRAQLAHVTGSTPSWNERCSRSRTSARREGRLEERRRELLAGASCAVDTGGLKAAANGRANQQLFAWDFLADGDGVVLLSNGDGSFYNELRPDAGRRTASRTTRELAPLMQTSTGGDMEKVYMQGCTGFRDNYNILSHELRVDRSSERARAHDGQPHRRLPRHDRLGRPLQQVCRREREQVAPRRQQARAYNMFVGSRRRCTSAHVGRLLEPEVPALRGRHGRELGQRARARATATCRRARSARRQHRVSGRAARS